MDKIYIPDAVSSLSREDTIALSEIRVILDDAVIDYEYSKMVSEYLLASIPIDKREHLIDFGCGGGFLIDCISSDYGIKKYTGLDLSANTLELIKKKYKTDYETSFSEFPNNGTIELPNNSVSSVVSCFVMHFEIYKEQMMEIYRVLIYGGIFVYNDYNYLKNSKRTSDIITMLTNIGFDVDEHIKTFKQDGVLKYHKVIKAIKLN